MLRLLLLLMMMMMITFCRGVDRRTEQNGVGLHATCNYHELILRRRLQSVNRQ